MRSSSADDRVDRVFSCMRRLSLVGGGRRCGWIVSDCLGPPERDDDARCDTRVNRASRDALRDAIDRRVDRARYVYAPLFIPHTGGEVVIMLAFHGAGLEPVDKLASGTGSIPVRCTHGESPDFFHNARPTSVSCTSGNLRPRAPVAVFGLMHQRRSFAATRWVRSTLLTLHVLYCPHSAYSPLRSHPISDEQVLGALLPSDCPFPLLLLLRPSSSPGPSCPSPPPCSPSAPLSTSYAHRLCSARRV